MKNSILLLFAVLSFSISSKAQSGSNGNKAELCADYDRTTGVPSGVGTAWDIASDGKGSNVYLIYTQAKTIKEDLSVYIDKKNSSGSYIAYGTYYFNNDTKTNPKKWAMYDVKFTEEGDYRISVVGKNADALAVTYADIAYMKNDDPSTANMKKNKSKSDIPDTYYYEDSKITFGESISNGVLSTESTVFKLSGSSKEITAKIEQADDLKLTKAIVSIYTGDDYKEKVSELSYTVDDKTWNWISVPIKFYKKGKYVVDVYSQDDIFINSGYFEVK